MKIDNVPHEDSNIKNLSKSSYKYIEELGNGSFGSVNKVRSKKTNKEYAMK